MYKEGSQGSTIEQLLSQADSNTFDPDILHTLQRIKGAEETTRAQAAKSLHAVADYITANSSHVLVTGRSGALSLRLLQSAGIDPKQITALGSEGNYALYRGGKEFTENIVLTKELLNRLGLLGEPLCIVDDHIDQGRKAADCVAVLSQIPDIPSFHFISFAVNPAMTSNGNISVAHIPLHRCPGLHTIGKEPLQKLIQKHVWVPVQGTDADVYHLFQDLAYAQKASTLTTNQDIVQITTAIQEGAIQHIIEHL